MRTQSRDIRCSRCGILLARIDKDGGLSIIRNGLQVHSVGRFRTAIVCYRRGCSTLNTVHLDSPQDIHDRVA